jgi:2-methylcitrate dehydratase PrpD
VPEVLLVASEYCPFFWERVVTMPTSAIADFASFVVSANVPDAARAAARSAIQDTVGVMLAGASQPAAQIVQRVAAADGGPGPSSILGTNQTAGSSYAALANGTAAHALDFDDMCWVTLAHPSTPLVAAGLAVGEVIGASSRVLLDAYVVGFEIEAVLGAVMNPSHYEHGWHCTSTIGTIGAAATAARVLGLDVAPTANALSIAASEASGLKENFGTMVKPLQGGLAARNGVLAALLAQQMFSASVRAIDGPQGFLVAMQSGGTDLSAGLAKLGHRWEIVDVGITKKLYPSCAATHPTIDALLDLRREYGLTPEIVDSIKIDVDAATPTVLIYDQPKTGLEGKFSLHYCAAAALAFGHVGLDTFEPESMLDPVVERLMSRVVMRADDTLEREAAPLTQARVVVHLRDGRTIQRYADGARGYPKKPATTSELDQKFIRCVECVLSAEAAADALAYLQQFDDVASVNGLISALSASSPQHA